jgi:hypothetical protein
MMSKRYRSGVALDFVRSPGRIKKSAARHEPRPSRPWHPAQNV